MCMCIVCIHTKIGMHTDAKAMRTYTHNTFSLTHDYYQVVTHTDAEAFIRPYIHTHIIHPLLLADTY